MATLVFGAIGSYYGGPAGGMIGSMIGSYIDTELLGLGPKAKDIKNKAPLVDTSVSASTYGRPWPLLYGSMRVHGNVIWSPGLTAHKNKDSESLTSGGFKGSSGPSVTSVTYSYTFDALVGFCVGPAETVARIWGDTKLIADFTGKTPAFGTKITKGNIRTYLGGEADLPDPAYQAHVGADDAVAHRGIVKVGFDEAPAIDFGNRLPQFSAEIVANSTPAYPLDLVQPTNEAIPNRAAWSPDGTILVTTSNNIIVTIDAISKEILCDLDLSDVDPDYADLAQFTNCMLDKHRQVYFWSGAPGGFKVIHQFDALTGAHKSSTTDSKLFGGTPQSTWDDFFVRRHLLAGADQQCLVCLGSTGTVASCYIKEGLITFIDAYALDAGYIGTAPTFSTNNSHGMACDGIGYAWVACPGSGSVWLIKLEPFNARPLAWFELPGLTFVSGLTYFEEENCLLVGTGDYLIKWSIDDEEEVSRVFLGGLNMEENAAQFDQGPIGGLLWLRCDLGSMSEIDVRNMEVLRSVDSTDWVVANIDQFIYDRINHALIGKTFGSSTNVRWLYLDRISKGMVTLQSIVEDISEKVDLTPNTDLDASSLTDLVRGYVIGSRIPARNGVENLMPCFFFDAVESDWMVDFVKRGGSSALSIPATDLGARAGSAQGVADLTEIRLQEVDLPERVDFTFPDPSRDYQPNTQSDKRYRDAVETRSVATFDAPVVFSATEGRQVAQKMLYQAWIARAQFEFNISYGYIRLDPTDVVTVTNDSGVEFELLVKETQFGADGVIRVMAEANDAEVYNSTIVGTSGDGFPEQTIEAAGASALYMMDVPLLRDVDEGLGMYFAAGSYGSSTWPGAGITQSADDATYSPFESVPSSRNVDHGASVDALTDTGNWTTWDRYNTLTVRLFKGSLTSKTELQVLNHANYLLVGNEWIQFATATLNADGTYTLSNLLRGRRGTEWAMSDHAPGDRVVVPTADTVDRATLSPTLLNQTRYYRAVTIGGILNAGFVQEVTFLGRSLQPYAPCSIKGTKGSPSDWKIEWLRRTRLGGEWLDDDGDVPLAEESEDYVVEIYSDSTFTTVERTITSTASAGGSVVVAASQEAWYSVADQVSDFGSEQSTLYVKVYQLSETVGRGFTRETTLAA
jgi:hypothetical protein